MSNTAGERRQRAVEAACEVLKRLGLPAADPVVLKDSNNTVVWLRPLGLVAKVGTSNLGACDIRGVDLEHGVLARLADFDCPVVRLAPRLPANLHQVAELQVLLLEYVEVQPEEDVPCALARQTVLSVHEAMRGYPDALPPFTAQLGRARALLAEVTATPNLEPDDRTLLQNLVEHYADAFSPGPAWAPLHGDPWVGGNLVRTRSSAVLLDFEAACFGPVEWDWSALPEDAAPPGLDGRLLEDLRTMRSLMVAVWCFAQPGRAPEVDEASAHHLSVLKQLESG